MSGAALGQLAAMALGLLALAWLLFAPWAWWPPADPRRPWLPMPTCTGRWQRRGRFWPWRVRVIEVSTTVWWAATTPAGICWTDGRSWSEFGTLDRWLYQYRREPVPGWELDQ